MSKFCVNCGVALDDNAAFCSNCGATVQASEPQQMPVQQQAPVYQQQPVNQAPAFVERIEDKAVSMWEYVGLLLLYSSFGWIAALIGMLVAKRTALKTFSKGYLIFSLINLAIAVVFVVVLFVIYGSIFAAILNGTANYSSYGY